MRSGCLSSGCRASGTCGRHAPGLLPYQLHQGKDAKRRGSFCAVASAIADKRHSATACSGQRAPIPSKMHQDDLQQIASLSHRPSQGSLWVGSLELQKLPLVPKAAAALPAPRAHLTVSCRGMDVRVRLPPARMAVQAACRPRWGLLNELAHGCCSSARACGHRHLAGVAGDMSHDRNPSQEAATRLTHPHPVGGQTAPNAWTTTNALPSSAS